MANRTPMTVRASHVWKAIGGLASCGAIVAFVAGQAPVGWVLVTGAFIAFVIGAYID